MLNCTRFYFELQNTCLLILFCFTFQISFNCSLFNIEKADCELHENPPFRPKQQMSSSPLNRWRGLSKDGKTLDLSRMKISNGRLSHLVRAINAGQFSRLEVLDLSHNDIGDSSVISQFSRSLMKLPHLKVLNLTGNGGIVGLRPTLERQIKIHEMSFKGPGSVNILFDKRW